MRYKDVGFFSLINKTGMRGIRIKICLVIKIAAAAAAAAACVQRRLTGPRLPSHWS